MPADGLGKLRLACTHYLEQLDNASSCAVLPDGSVLVANTGMHEVLVVSPNDGEVLGAFGRELVNGRLRGPRGLVATSTELFVADCYVRPSSASRARAAMPDCSTACVAELLREEEYDLQKVIIR